MAIATGVGAAASSTVAVASQALASITPTTGRDLIFFIALGSTASSISSITSSAGSYVKTFIGAKNGTGIRVECWQVHVTTGAATVFTANITGGNTTCAVAAEEYSGVNAVGNNGNNSGSSFEPYAQVTEQDINNFSVFGIGVANSSGDTITASAGTERQKSIPAATASAVQLLDQSGVLAEQPQAMSMLNNSRNWAVFGVELRSGSATAGTIADFPSLSTNMPALVGALTPSPFLYLKLNTPTFMSGSLGFDTVPVWGTFGLADGYEAQAYQEQWYLEKCGTPVTFTLQLGTLPTGIALSSLGGAEGQLAGTPTLAGVYSFTIRATNSFGFADKAFTLTVNTASSGGGVFTFSQA